MILSYHLFQELDLHDIPSFDAELGKVLGELHAIVCRKQHLESATRNNRDVVTDLRFRGARIEDLCLDFTLPGYPDYVMKPGDETVCDFYCSTAWLMFIDLFVHKAVICCSVRLIYITWRSTYPW